MSEKVSSKDLVRAVAQKSGVTPARIHEFVEVFQVLFEEALIRDKQIKVTGLGTFKLLWHSPRKSVNVNTGEEIEIAGHYKLNFVPDTSLANSINEPFAHLNAVELSEDNVVEIEPILSDNVDVLEDELDVEMRSQEVEQQFDGFKLPLNRLNKQAAEVKSLLNGIMGESDGVDLSDEEVNEHAMIEITQPQAEAVVEVEDSPTEATLVEDSCAEDSPIKDTNDEVSNEEIFSLGDQQRVEKSSSDSLSTNEDASLRSRKKTKMILGVMVCGLLILSLLGYFYARTSGESMDFRKLFVQQHNEVSDAKKDTIVENAGMVIPEEPIMVYDSTYYFPPQMNYEQFDKPRKLDSLIIIRTITSSDRLVSLALQYYGSKDFWVYIYEANQDVLQHPNTLEVGQKIKIPVLDPILINYNDTACVKYCKMLGNHYVK